MPTTKYLLLLLGLFASISLAAYSSGPLDEALPEAKKRQFYQLKTYTFATDAQLAVTEKYLQAAYLPALKRLGIGPVGVFKPHAEAGETAAAKKVYVLIPFTSLSQLTKLEGKLAKDATYVTAGREYLTATHDAVPYERVESILLQAFAGMPQMVAPTFGTPRTDRVYELRSYEGPTEAYYTRKVDMFNNGGEIELFTDLEFNAVFYAEVLSGPKMPNLMYMTSFSDRASRDAHWKAFGESEAWKGMKDLPQYLNTVSHADIYLLYPTAYSAY